MTGKDPIKGRSGSLLGEASRHRVSVARSRGQADRAFDLEEKEGGFSWNQKVWDLHLPHL